MKENVFRKALVLMLTAMILCSLVPIAQAATSINIKAPDVISNVAGEGFLDIPGQGGTAPVDTLETNSDGSVCLRKGEWAKYDLSSLELGEYAVTIEYANNAVGAATVFINDNELISSKQVPVTGSYSIFQTQMIGFVNVTEENSLLTYQNTGATAIFLKSITLSAAAPIKNRQAFAKIARPYKMSYLPCLIQGEYYDSGVSGQSFYALDDLNQGKVFRLENGIDIYEEQEGGYSIRLLLNEWVNYTFHAKKTGNFDLIFSCLDNFEESKIRLYLDGYEIIRLIPEGVLPSDKKAETPVGTFNIKEGVHTLTVKCLEGDFSYDYMRFATSDKEGMDTSDISKLRPWTESQELTEEDNELYSPTVDEVHEVEREIYVKAGAQSGNGTASAPFGTIEQAKDYVKTVNGNMKGDIIVHLEGEFKLSETIKFDTLDSGTNGFNIIYKGDDKTTIHGGRKVEGWKQVEGSPIWQAEIPKEISDFRQFYVGENRAQRSRTKWLYWMEAEWDDPETDYNAFEEGYIIKGKDFPEGFKKPDELEMCFLPSWKSWRFPVKSIETLEDGNILVKPEQPYFNTIQQSATIIRTAHGFYFENAPEFFDEPGEFYFNKDTHILSYYPTDYEDMATIDCYVPVVEGLISLEGESKNNKISNITFEGISFRYSAWERPTEQGFGTTQADALLDSMYSDEFGNTIHIPAAVQIEYGDNINFIKNEIAFVGAGGIAYGQACSKSEVTGNIFDSVAATSLTLGTWKLPRTAPLSELTRKITVRNNLVRRTGVEYMTPAITSYHTNSVHFDHNDLLDTPYSGFSIGWGWGKDVLNNKYNKATNNRIENSGYKVRDGGSIYNLDPNMGGEIKGNYMLYPQDMKGGVYLDNSSAYWTITENVTEVIHEIWWIKLTYGNIHDNTAFNNYANTGLINLFPENNNNFEPAKGMVNGEWPDEAKKIIENAGLEDEYKYLLEKYALKGTLRNDILEPQPYHEFINPGIFLSAGNDIMEGGEGEAFHDLVGDGWVSGVPGRSESYQGQRAVYLMATGEGEWTKYKFTVDEAGEYDIVPSLGVVTEGTAMTVEVDDKILCENLTLEPNCLYYDEFELFPAGTVYLEPGEHTVKVVHAKSNFGFDGIFIKKSTDEFGERKEGYVKEYMDIILNR